jgi:hypothetical protein
MKLHPDCVSFAPREYRKFYAAARPPPPEQLRQNQHLALLQHQQRYRGQQVSQHKCKSFTGKGLKASALLPVPFLLI